MASDSKVQIQLRLLGAALFKREVDRSSRSLGGLGGAAKKARGAVQGAVPVLGKVRQVVGGVAATAVKAATALVAVGSAAGGLVLTNGFRLNAQWQSLNAQFTTLIGSRKRAEKWIESMRQVTAMSPLRLTEALDGARGLLAAGMRLGRIRDTVAAMQNASLVGKGKPAETYSRIAEILGVIQARGSITATELARFDAVGLSVRRILRRELGLTADEVAEIGRHGVTAKQAIGALTRAWTSGSMRRAVADASATWEVQTATFRKLWEQLQRVVTEPLFSVANQRLLPWLIDKVSAGVRLFSADDLSFGEKLERILGGLGKGLAGGGLRLAGMLGLDVDEVRAKAGAVIASIRGAFKSASGMVSRLLGRVDPAAVLGKVRDAAAGARDVVGQVIAALSPALPFVRNVLIPLLQGVAAGVISSVVAAFKVAVPIVRLLATGLGWLGDRARPLRGLFQGIGFVVGWLFTGPILKLISGLGRAGGVFGLFGVAAKVARLPLLWLGLHVKVLTRVVGFLSGALAKGVVFVQRFAATFRNAAARAISAAAGIVRSAVGRIVDGLKGAARRVLAAGGDLGLKIIEGIVSKIKGAAGEIAAAVTSVVPGPVRGALGFAGDVGGAALSGAGRMIFGNADGGLVGRGGWSVVGERGPELVRFPTGGRVYPTALSRGMASDASADSSGGGGWLGHLTLNVDGLGVIHRGLVRFERSREEAR